MDLSNHPHGRWQSQDPPPPAALGPLQLWGEGWSSSGWFRWWPGPAPSNWLSPCLGFSPVTADTAVFQGLLGGQKGKQNTQPLAGPDPPPRAPLQADVPQERTLFQGRRGQCTTDALAARTRTLLISIPRLHKYSQPINPNMSGNCSWLGTILYSIPRKACTA